MQELTEIRWHARAGQGAVTAAKMVAEIAMMDGRYMQSMPEYGPERTGAPLKAFTRLSNEPIEVHNNIVNPDISILLDETLIGTVDFLEGIKDSGTLIVNSRKTPDEMRVLANVPTNVKVVTVDATGIALDELNRDLPNTPVVAALAKVTGVIDLDGVNNYIRDVFSKRFNEKIIAGNFEAARRAAEEVHE